MAAETTPSPLSFEQIFQGAPDPMVVVDDAGIIVSANARILEVLGYDASKILGETVEALVPTALREEHVGKRRGYMAKARTRPMATGLKLHALHRDGREIPVEISLSPCWSGGRLYIIATIRDVTRLRAMEEEVRARSQALEASNRELEQFAYVASHDLQEPLRHITGFCQILQDDHTSALDEDGHHCLDVIIEATSRMSELINDLLDYSRVGRGMSSPGSIEVREVIDVVLGNLDQTIHEAGADIVVGPLPSIRGDSLHLTMIFQNLIANAIKFSREGTDPRIEIRADREGDDAWRFSVQDNGIGIEPDHMARIFEIFQKLHARQEYEGTGIGLAVVRKMITHLGGRIWVESTPGEGSTFVFVLPDTEPTDQGDEDGQRHGGRTARRRQPA